MTEDSNISGAVGGVTLVVQSILGRLLAKQGAKDAADILQATRKEMEMMISEPLKQALINGDYDLAAKLKDAEDMAAAAISNIAEHAGVTM